MNMESVYNRFRALTYEAVCEWVGPVTGGRGRAYRSNVGELFALLDGFAAHVQGTKMYTTNVYVDADGEFSSVCSCPVGVNCKHGAALALVVAEKLQSGLDAKIPEVSDETLKLDRDSVTVRVCERVRASRERKAVRAERFNPFAPIPEYAPDFARRYTGSAIAFPNNRFVTSMWPNIRCTTADEVRKALASFRLEGRVLGGIRLFGDSSSSDEASLLGDAGIAIEADSDSRKVRRAYAQMPLTARVLRQIETRRLVRIEFRSGGTFEVDTERAPDFYLAMNQIDAGTRPKRPVNVDGEVLFAPLAGRTVERVEVVASMHDSDPFYFNAYDEPKELADAIVLRLDTGDGLRFRTEWNDLLVDVVDSTGAVKKTSWGSVKEAFYNRADVNIDKVTGVESRSRSLYFGNKGVRYAEHDCISFNVMKKGRAVSRRVNACVRRDHAAFFALADYVLRPTLKPGSRELSRREWTSYLTKVRQLMGDKRFAMSGGRAGVLAAAFRDSHDLLLLDDIERWTRKAMGEQDRIRIEGMCTAW